jgi:endonuclease/exonuclease/phosphatase family metal-dependent hydrolase
MESQPLSLDLRELSCLMREHARSDIALSPAACRRLSVVLALAARKADELEAKAVDAEALEEELLLVAGDLANASGRATYQDALKAQQAEIQRQLDGGQQVHVARPGLAALSTPIGDTNVVTFPRAPRPQPVHCQGGDGGDAA